MHLSKLTLHSLFLKIPTDGDKTTLLDRLFQAPTARSEINICGRHCNRNV